MLESRIPPERQGERARERERERERKRERERERASPSAQAVVGAVVFSHSLVFFDSEGKISTTAVEHFRKVALGYRLSTEQVFSENTLNAVIRYRQPSSREGGNKIEL